MVAARRERERKCRGGKLFGHAVPCPACGAKLREERAKVCGFCYASKVARIGCPQEEKGKGTAGSGCLPQAFPVLRGKALQRAKKSGQIPMGLTAFELIWKDIKPYRSRKNSRILADTERYL